MCIYIYIHTHTDINYSITPRFFLLCLLRKSLRAKEMEKNVFKCGDHILTCIKYSINIPSDRNKKSIRSDSESSFPDIICVGPARAFCEEDNGDCISQRWWSQWPHPTCSWYNLTLTLLPLRVPLVLELVSLWDCLHQ